MKSLTILNLYPNEMNIYGDRGNLLALVKRAEQHGFTVKCVIHEINQKFNDDVDIVLGGGGQDSGQNKIQKDLLKNGSKLRKMAERGTPMLMICGLYQLFGHYFEATSGDHIDGIGVFDAWTTAGPNRMIGNIVTETDFGELVGYENHSGMTNLNVNQPVFGKVLRGDGNNGIDKTEGARTNNVFGSYLHGPILPKNPMLIDELIKIAAINKYSEFIPSKIDDSVAIRAHNIASSRPR